MPSDSDNNYHTRGVGSLESSPDSNENNEKFGAVLKKPCPECKSIVGWIEVIRVKKRAKRTTMDFNGNRIEKDVKSRRKHKEDPQHSDTSLSQEGKVDNTNPFAESLGEYAAVINAVAETLWILYQRYPAIAARDSEFAQAARVAIKMEEPYTDLRYRRDWISYFIIMMDVHASGYNAAASLDAIRDSDGKVVDRLSVQHIRKKEKEVEKMALASLAAMPSFIDFMKLWSYIVTNDPVIKTEFLTNLEKSLEEAQALGKIKSDQDNDSYVYYYVNHYNPETYKENKARLGNRRYATGKVRHGPFTRSQVV